MTSLVNIRADPCGIFAVAKLILPFKVIAANEGHDGLPAHSMKLLGCAVVRVYEGSSSV